MWLSDEKWYSMETYEGQTFLLLNADELEAFCHGDLSSSVLGEPKQILNYDNYTIAIFDYNISECFK